MRQLSFALGCLLLAAACGDDGDGNGGEEMSPSDFIQEIAVVSCDHMYRCCTEAELMDEAFAGDTPEECASISGGFISAFLLPTMNDSIASGRMIFHGDIAEDCIAAMAALSCAEYASGEATVAAGCDDPFEGTVDNGGECGNDWDCVSDYCSGDSLDMDGNPQLGVCADEPGLGDACDDGSCGDNLDCDFSAETPVCVEPPAEEPRCDGV